MAQPALIFIPDISGFTRFVTRTEIQHASHITSELLDVIVGSNGMGLDVSEIEGDAVLFYRLGDPPDPGELLDQVERTFVAFHRLLKTIDRDSVCRCGACTTASGLSLKFVAHHGLLDVVRVRGFLKLMGQDVVLAHRLLKNGVPDTEYLLATDPLLDRLGSDASVLQTWAPLRKHVEVVPEFGRVQGAFLPLAHLRERVGDPPPHPELTLAGGGVALSTRIQAPVGIVHDYVTDMRKRTLWTEGLVDIVGDQPINRIGGAHTCVFDDLEVHVVTVDHHRTNEGFRYAESGEARGLTLVTDFRLQESDGVTTLDVRVVPGPADPAEGRLRRWLTRIRYRIVLVLLKRSLARSLRALKDLCERSTATPIRSPEDLPPTSRALTPSA